MQNVKLTIAYDGTKYNGWQIQKNGVTVQEKLEKAIEKVYKKKHRLYGASRTDSGVHALCQTANFKTELLLPNSKISHAINTYLPQDIVVIKSQRAGDTFHSQYDAKMKTYRYHIKLTDRRDPFRDMYQWRIPYELNVSSMRKEAKVLVGKHDFRSFKARQKKEKTSIRTIYSISITLKKQDVIITVKGDGFLYNMVRNIVGTLVDIGRGYLPSGSMKNILNQKDRTKAGPTAPAKGLFLTNIQY